jgi:hypothetical protein
MKIANERGFGVIEVLLGVIIIGGLLFVQNPLSSSLGVGIRPNKTIQKEYTKETVELLKDKDGNVIGTKTIAKGQVTDQDLQQRVSLWEQFRSLPVLWLILSILGAAAVPGFGFMKFLNGRIKKRWKQVTAEKDALMTDTRKMVKGLDAAFASLPESLANLPGEIDRVALAKRIRDDMEWELRAIYNESTKDLVRTIRGAS